MMNGQLKGFHKDFLVKCSNVMLQVVPHVIGVSVEDNAGNATPPYPTAVVTDYVRVRMLGEEFHGMNFLDKALGKEM